MKINIKYCEGYFEETKNGWEWVVPSSCSSQEVEDEKVIITLNGISEYCEDGSAWDIEQDDEDSKVLKSWLEK